MKFNVGDKVRIKKDLSQCKFGGSTYMNEYMNEYVGKEATVTETYDSGLIKLDIDGNEWNWREEVLELIEDSEKKMRRIDYVLNAKDPIKVLVEEFDLKLNCGVCPGVNCDCEESCGYYLKQYLEQEIEVNESDLKNVEISKEVEDKKNCKDCDYFVKSSLGNYCDFYGILLNIMHGCNEFQLKKHKEGVENIENDQINPFMEEYVKIEEGKIIDMKEESVENDPVNHPSHYTDTKIEVMDYIEDKGFNFALGNAVKYISRAGKKDKNKTIQDLEKAEWYLNREIKRLKKLQGK